MTDDIADKPLETPVSENKSDVIVEAKTAPESTPEKKDNGEMKVTDLWGDSRMNPHFLTVAGYFGVTERDYRNAEPKINEILRWAEIESQSKDIGDIIKKISDTSKSLQSPGMGEKAYAILYRYIKLSNTKRSLEKEMDAYKKETT